MLTIRLRWIVQCKALGDGNFRVISIRERDNKVLLQNLEKREEYKFVDRDSITIDKKAFRENANRRKMTANNQPIA